MSEKPFRYFIPEWNDRVDPDYNFITDEHTPNRDPYEDDVYCHEIFDPPPYDGILISKVVIEENKSKKARIQRVGVHKYVRAPKGLPIMGDCGAFGYVGDYEPPFETDEIVQYYENFGFDYGVSIDHLMIPSLMQKKVVNHAIHVLVVHRILIIANLYWSIPP